MDIKDDAIKLKKEYYKEYRLNNRDKINDYQRKYRAKNKDKIKQYNHNYWLKKAMLLQDK